MALNPSEGGLRETCFRKQIYLAKPQSAAV